MIILKGGANKIEQIKELSKAVRESIREAERDIAMKEQVLQNRMKSIGNLVHESVPVSKDEVSKDNYHLRPSPFLLLLVTV